VHWHGLRLENKYDGVPHATQAPIPVGGSYSYRIQVPDPGLYWYHPHIREDYTQELGLYGNIVVVPAEGDYWPPVDRDFIITLDDMLLEDGRIAPFSRTETSYAAMGRFGNVFLVAGNPDLHLTAAVGEVVRLWLTNTVGQRVKIRLINEMDSDHPMHHPFHLHGAGRFLVLAREGIVEPNLVWKDTVLIRTGQTVDILFDVSNPGLWMAHCHIAEHMQSGMMFSFTVSRR
jgi:FtsP/CotA-like multicopper oxidase with cupredoxin domain